MQARGCYVVVAYADCGTYGVLDGVCERLRIGRLRGLHCYDVFAGPERMEELFAAEPGTYVLTDFLVRSFRRTVLSELGLDRHPELWTDYFGHYRRVVWLAQRRTAALGSRGTRRRETCSGFRSRSSRSAWGRSSSRSSGLVYAASGAEEGRACAVD